MIVKIKFRNKDGERWNPRTFYYQTPLDLRAGDLVTIRTQHGRPCAIVVETGILIDEVPEAYRYNLGVIVEKYTEGERKNGREKS